MKEWEVVPFNEIKVDQIMLQAEMFYKIVRQCERNLPSDSTAVAKLRNIVFDFKETMPIVQAMGNLLLKEHHWTEIKAILNLENQVDLE